MPQTDEHDLVQRTQDSIKRFVQYDKSVEADPAFRATVGASQPKVASSLLPPPKVGKWKVKVVDTVEAEKQQPVKTLHRPGKKMLTFIETTRCQGIGKRRGDLVICYLDNNFAKEYHFCMYIVAIKMNFRRWPVVVWVGGLAEKKLSPLHDFSGHLSSIFPVKT